MANPFMPGANPKDNLTKSHSRAVRQEKETAARFKGFCTPASGSRDIKGDVRVRGVARIECKTTKHKSFTVTLDMVRKIEEAAASTGEMPVLLVEFNDGDGRKLGEVAVVPSYLIDDLIERKA